MIKESSSQKLHLVDVIGGPQCYLGRRIATSGLDGLRQVDNWNRHRPGNHKHGATIIDGILE